MYLCNTWCKTLANMSSHYTQSPWKSTHFYHLIPVQEERALVCRIHQELNCSLTPKYTENTVRVQCKIKHCAISKTRHIKPQECHLGQFCWGRDPAQGWSEPGDQRGLDCWHFDCTRNLRLHQNSLSFLLNYFVVKTSCSPPASAVPGVEGQKFGVHQYESVQNLLACSVHVAVDLLHQPTLQKLDALLTKGRVDQPFHSLNTQRTRHVWTKAKPSIQLIKTALPHTPPLKSFGRALVSGCTFPGGFVASSITGSFAQSLEGAIWQINLNIRKSPLKMLSSVRV